MTILITGGSGFVGAHMVAALGRRFPGTPIVVADLGTPPADVLAFWQGLPVRLHMLDVTDRQAVETLMVKVRPRLVVHAAAITPTTEQEAADPVRIVDVNLGGTLSLLDAATRSQGIERVLICSSAAVYGFGAYLPYRIDETMTPAPTGLYGMTKVACEGLAQRFGELRGVSTAAVRIAACYGAMERLTDHRAHMSQVYPLFCALASGRQITAAGSAAVRDWTDADDIGDGVAALLAAPSLTHQVYNLGSGTGYVWSDVLAAFARHGLDIRATSSADAEATFDEALSRAPLAIDRMVADTGFVPTRTLDAAIAHAAMNRKPPG